MRKFLILNREWKKMIKNFLHWDLSEKRILASAGWDENELKRQCVQISESLIVNGSVAGWKGTLVV